MGGCAHIIPGHVPEQVLQRPVEQPGFWARIFGRKAEEVRRVDWGDSTMIEVPCPGLSSEIQTGFQHYLKEQFSTPNEPTSFIFDYLRIGVINVYIRGDETAKGCTWYAQITFSGCAGMAQVSSEVCAHWAEKWVAEKFDDTVEPLLGKHGFEARPADPLANSENRFICVEIEGVTHYAGVYDGEVGLDGAIYEGVCDDSEEFQEDLKTRCAAQIAAGQCECQMCQR